MANKLITPKSAKEREDLRKRSVQERDSFGKSWRYSAKLDAYELALNSGVRVIIPRHYIAELAHLSKADAGRVQLSEFGDAIRLESQDLAISMTGLVRACSGLTMHSAAAV